MKRLLVVISVFLSTALSNGATIVSGCVTDGNGKPVQGAEVLAGPAKAKTRKSDGCYEMQIKKDGTYDVGVRDARFRVGGATQTRITVAGLDVPNVDLTTDIPNQKLLNQEITNVVLSAGTGFQSLRTGITQNEVPIVTAEMVSGFMSCVLQSSRNPYGPTNMLWCDTGLPYWEIRKETDTRAMFQIIHDSIASTLSSLGQLRYSELKLAGETCQNCVERTIWISPINGVVSLNRLVVKKRNFLVLWAAYNTNITEEGCAALKEDREPKVEFAQYDSAVQAMRDEYQSEIRAAIKVEMGMMFGVGGGSMWPCP